MYIQRVAFWAILITTAFLAGCKKYSLAPEMKDPAYLRIFNDIPYTLDATSAGQPLPFLTFLMDPQMDKDGIPGNAEIMGDYLVTRQIYSLSYPLNAGNINSVINYDYPGNARVQTAPPINGLDLSAWAQIPSGKHRIMFVTRPFTDTPFVNLPAKARQRILIDTTIDFQAGEVHTMEVVAKDIDKYQYGLYLRKESFIHEKFDEDKIYTSFYNLSGYPSLAFNSLYCKDTLNITYSYMMQDPIRTVPNVAYFYSPVFPHFDVPLTSIQGRFATSAPFTSIPALPRSYFFDVQGLLKTYSPLNPPPGGSSRLGTLPFIGFTFRNTAGNLVKKGDNYNIYLPGKTMGFSVYGLADPAKINVYDVDMRSSNGVDAYAAIASLNLITNINGKLNISSTINIVELVYGRAYHMQIQKLYSSPYKN